MRVGHVTQPDRPDGETTHGGGVGHANPLWWMRWVPAVALVLFAGWLLYVFGRVALVPLLTSFAIAYLLNPIVCRLEARGIGRGIAALLAMLVVGGAFVALVAFVIPGLWRETVAAGQQVSATFSGENVAQLRERLAAISPALDRLVGGRLEVIARDPASVLGGASQWFAGALTGVMSTAVASLDFLLVPFFAYYILIDFPAWRRSLETLIPPRYQPAFHPLFDEIGRILEAYVTGQLLVALCMAVLYAIGFWLLDVPAWAGIAAIAGLLNAVPYIGTAIGLVLALTFTFADGGGLWRLGGVTGVFVLVQNVEGFYLTPRILGGRLQLHPMAVFLGILIGGNLFGLLGILLAIPSIAVAKVLAKFVRELYLGSRFYRGRDLSTPPTSLPARVSSASEQVMRQQRRASSGEELLAPEDEATHSKREGKREESEGV
jgi:predicted PurR-regulated permease PerM